MFRPTPHPDRYESTRGTDTLDARCVISRSSQGGLMPVSLQVLYPVGEGTHFDHDYYANKHFEIVDNCAGEHIQSRVVT